MYQSNTLELIKKSYFCRLNNINNLFFPYLCKFVHLQEGICIVLINFQASDINGWNFEIDIPLNDYLNIIKQYQTSHKITLTNRLDSLRCEQSSRRSILCDQIIKWDMNSFAIQNRLANFSLKVRNEVVGDAVSPSSQTLSIQKDSFKNALNESLLLNQRKQKK